MRLPLVPWILALVGLAIPLVGSGFVVWPMVVVWLAVLSGVWLLSRLGPPRTSREQITLAVAALPILVVLAWEGGWWLIPADLAWLLVAVVGGRHPGPTT